MGANQVRLAKEYPNERLQSITPGSAFHLSKPNFIDYFDTPSCFPPYNVATATIILQKPTSGRKYLRIS